MGQRAASGKTHAVAVGVETGKPTDRLNDAGWQALARYARWGSAHPLRDVLIAAVCLGLGIAASFVWFSGMHGGAWLIIVSILITFGAGGVAAWFSCPVVYAIFVRLFGVTAGSIVFFAACCLPFVAAIVAYATGFKPDAVLVVRLIPAVMPLLPFCVVYFVAALNTLGRPVRAGNRK